MQKRTQKFGAKIAELKEIIEKYGCNLGSCPPYIVYGQYNSATGGPVYGILAAAQCQFYAYLILREVRKSGRADVERTEYHPKPTFRIDLYKQQLKDRMAAQKKAEADANRPKLRIVSSDGKDT